MPCRRLDADRIEQVISNLLGNAVTHGDVGQPVAVSVALRGGVASLAVRNGGKPIEPDLLAALFDPFTRFNPSSRKTFRRPGPGPLHRGADRVRPRWRDRGRFLRERRDALRSHHPDPRMTGESQVVERNCVLVVDDEQDIRETLSELVEMAGCSALLASKAPRP